MGVLGMSDFVVTVFNGKYLNDKGRIVETVEENFRLHSTVAHRYLGQSVMAAGRAKGRTLQFFRILGFAKATKMLNDGSAPAPAGDVTLLPLSDVLLVPSDMVPQ